MAQCQELIHNIVTQKISEQKLKRSFILIIEWFWLIYISLTIKTRRYGMISMRQLFTRDQLTQKLTALGHCTMSLTHTAWSALKD